MYMDIGYGTYMYALHHVLVNMNDAYKLLGLVTSLVQFYKLFKNIISCARSECNRLLQSNTPCSREYFKNYYALTFENSL